MSKKDKELKILFISLIISVIIIFGLIIWLVISYNTPKQNLGEYQKCLEDLNLTRSNLEISRGDETLARNQLANALNDSSSCHILLNNITVERDNLKKILDKPNTYFIFGNNINLNYSQIINIIYSLLIISIILPISIIINLFKVEIKTNIPRIIWFLIGIASIIMFFLVISGNI